MKAILIAVTFLFFLITLPTAKAASIIQITNLDTGTMLSFELGVNTQDIEPSRYINQDKIVWSMYSWYPQWNTNLSDVYFGIAAPAGQTLQTGSYYSNINQFGFYPNEPQLQWGTLNTSEMGKPGSSWFKVLEVNYTGPGLYSNVAIDAMDGNGNFISARYKSDIPLTTIPEPGSLMIGGASLLLFLYRRQRR